MVGHPQIKVDKCPCSRGPLIDPTRTVQLQVKAEANGLGTVNRLHALHL